MMIIHEWQKTGISMDYVKISSSFDDDDNKYRKTWIRSTRTTIIAGIVIICIFVAVMRISSASYLLIM